MFGASNAQVIIIHISWNVVCFVRNLSKTVNIMQEIKYYFEFGENFVAECSEMEILDFSICPSFSHEKKRHFLPLDSCISPMPVSFMLLLQVLESRDTT